MNIFKNSKKVTIGLVLLLFVLFNWLSYGFYVRFDLSATGRYKLTSASKKILKGLPGKVTIEAYFSKDISETYYQSVKQLRDFLQEYASSSRGRVKLVFLNPDDDEEIQQKARSLGIQPMPIGSVDKKKREVSRVYLSLALYYEDKTQVIPDILKQSQALEYFLTANIYKMAYPLDRNIGYVATPGTFSTSEQQNPFFSLDILNRSLSTFYGEIRPVNASNAIESNISVLFIVSPSHLTEDEKYNIDQYIMKGGKVILAMSGVEINFNNLMVTPKDQDVIDFFSHYGLNFSKGLVFDSKNFLPFRQPVNMLQMIEIPYPVWLVVPEDYLSQKSLLTENFQFLMMPWASSLSIDSNKIKDPKVTNLAKTSPMSWEESEHVTISPEILKDKIDNLPDPSTMKQYTLASDIQGKFSSYFNGKPLSPDMKNFVPESASNSEIVAVSTPYAFTDNIQPIHITQNLNINFFLTILDKMHGLDELVKSRNRGQVPNPQIGPVDYWMKNMIVILNFGLPIVFIIGFGFVRLMNRRKMQQHTYNDVKNKSEAVSNV